MIEKIGINIKGNIIIDFINKIIVLVKQINKPIKTN